MQAVTMGEKASDVAQELFKGDQYSDCTSTVLRCRWPKPWRSGSMPVVNGQLLPSSRYSFGYPACPNVADSRQQLDWLGADRIGLSMDSSDQLSPEQSTTALVALHSKARYFSA